MTKSKGLTAKVSITINVSVAKVWDAFINPKVIEQYTFGTKVVSDWKEGSSIVWKGEWQGTVYEDKGVILKLEPPRLIQYSHFSQFSGLPDVPDNYDTVTVKLSGKGAQTLVSISLDNNATERQRENSGKTWETMMEGLKTLLEKGSTAQNKP